MTQEEKDLLLKDLCARLPYGIIVTDNRHGNSVITEIDTISDTVYCYDFDEYVSLEKCLPYLRPMSSMTEEEWNDYKSTWKLIEHDLEDTYEPCIESFDWFNANHFDYRGLIPKGLALEAPEGMYDLKEK